MSSIVWEALRRILLNILLAEDDRNLGIIVKRELEEEGQAADLVNDRVESVRYLTKPLRLKN